MSINAAPAPVADSWLVEVKLGPDRRPCGAVATCRVAAPPSKVFALLRTVEEFEKRVPMIHRSRREGSRIHLDLRFKMALFSAKFGVIAEITEVPDRVFELRWISGEPRGLHIRYELEPIPGNGGDGGGGDTSATATSVRTEVGFDITSLGWLVKFFLHHHPEIQFGVFPGTALVLQDALLRSFV